MKILNILDHSLPLHSGYTFRSQNIFRAQRKMGYDPVILTSPKHEESLNEKTGSVEEINGFTYYRTGLPGGSSLPVVPELKLMYRLYKRIMAVAGMEKPDIIHAHSPILNAIPAIWASKKLKIPIVYEIRAFWEDAAVDHGTYVENSWKYNLTKNIETRVCRKVDHVCILCKGLKEDLISRSIPADKITPVYNGINPDDLKPVPPDFEYLESWNLESKKVIGFVGSFYRYEGLDLLIQAFAKVALIHGDAMLLLVGGGETVEELKALAANLSIEDRVVIPGRVPHERIAGVYSMIDILAYPRYSMRLTELVTPLKPLEAMAMEKALVASDIGGHRELIQDNETGLLFKAGDVQHLFERIKSILDDETLEKSLREKGSQWVREHHTWESTTSVYGKIYTNLLNSWRKK